MVVTLEFVPKSDLVNKVLVTCGIVIVLAPAPPAGVACCRFNVPLECANCTVLPLLSNNQLVFTVARLVPFTVKSIVVVDASE